MGRRAATSRSAPARGGVLGLWLSGQPPGPGAGRALTCVLVVEGVHAREVDGERLEGGGQAEAALRALHARAGAGRLGRGGGGGRLGQLGRPILDAEYGARRGGGGPEPGRGSAAGLAGAAGPACGRRAGGPGAGDARCSRRRRSWRRQWRRRGALRTAAPPAGRAGRARRRRRSQSAPPGGGGAARRGLGAGRTRAGRGARARGPSSAPRARQACAPRGGAGGRLSAPWARALPPLRPSLRPQPQTRGRAPSHRPRQASARDPDPLRRGTVRTHAPQRSACHTETLGFPQGPTERLQQAPAQRQDRPQTPPGSQRTRRGSATDTLRQTPDSHGPRR